MIKLHNITKVFDVDSDLKIALNNINLEIEEGEFVTVIGANGSGKSTLFNLISGNYFPTKGRILINDEDVTKLELNKRVSEIGVVFQDPLSGTAKDMSVIENLILANIRNKRRTLKWGFKKDDNEFYKTLLKTLNLGLENNLNKKIGTLSGGQRQAITLLMATLSNPKLLLLDEHTAALDPKTAETVLNITNQIVKEKNLTTIMITHNMRDALNYGNRLIMLKDGEIVFDVKGSEKESLTIKELLFKFEDIE